MGAIRECFEESGILLAKRIEHPELLLEVNDEERDKGRRAVHENSVKFQDWVRGKGGSPDTGMKLPILNFLLLEHCLQMA